MIFVKNVKKLYTCKLNFGQKNRNLGRIHFKIDILFRYCQYKLESKYYKFKVYRDFVSFVCDNLFNLFNISKNNNVCSLCDTEYFLMEKCRNLIDEIYEEKRSTGYEFCRFVEVDFVRVIIRNLYKIINYECLYIERFGGLVKNYNFKYLFVYEYKIKLD